MTRLTKPVKRIVGPMLRGGDAGSYAVTLLPPGLLEFRRLRCRKRFVVSLETCYRLAATIEAEQLRKARVERRRMRARHGRKGEGAA